MRLLQQHQREMDSETGPIR